MSTHRSPTTRTATLRRLSAVFVAAALLVSACGSSDDGGTEVVSQAEGTPAVDNGAGQDGGDDTPTTAPVAEPTDEATTEPIDPSTPVPTKAPTTAPTSTAVPTPTVPTAEPTSEPDTIPIESPDLVGQNWYVQAVDSAGGDVLPRPNGAVAQIRFNEDGTVTGNAACNNFTANYTIDGAALSITGFAITEMNCFIPDWSAFVDFLPQTTGYGSAGGPDPILFVGSDSSISLGSTPPGPATTPADPASTIDDYIGLTELEAAQLADTRGVAFRVSSIDGEPQAVTMDFNAERVNVELVKGVVVAGSHG